MTLCSVDPLPAVTHSLGVVPVIPLTTSMRAGSTPSSSAATAATAVRMPWPSSTFPVWTATRSGATIRTHRSSSGTPASDPSRRARLGGRTAISAGSATTGGASVGGAGDPSASRAARTIRGWAPQRHRWSSSARRTPSASSASPRRTTWASVTTMPGRQ